MKLAASLFATLVAASLSATAVAAETKPAAPATKAAKPAKPAADGASREAGRNWTAIDTNKDGLISPEEMEAFLQANPGPLKGK